MATPAPSALIELLKPITWFAPMWAFTCGVVSSGASPTGQWPVIAAGVDPGGSPGLRHLARRSTTGTIATSTPSTSRTGRSPRVGCPGAGASTSPPAGPSCRSSSPPPSALDPRRRPLRPRPGLDLQRPAPAPEAQRLVGQFGGGDLLRRAALVHRRRGDGRPPSGPARPAGRRCCTRIGAHGIMTLNDFKSVEGDAPHRHPLPARSARHPSGPPASPASSWPSRRWPSSRLPVRLEPALARGRSSASCCSVSSSLMRRLLAAPRERAAWYNGTGTTLYVLGMLVAAFALRPLVQGASVMAEPDASAGSPIVRLGLVQTALGAVVVLMTSTINRVMVVELALPADRARRRSSPCITPFRSCARAGATARIVGGRRTPWIVGGMAALALGGFGAAVATAAGRDAPGRRPRAGGRSPSSRVGMGAGAAGTSLLVLLATGVDARRAGRGRHPGLGHDDRGLRHHGAAGRALPRSLLGRAAGRRLRHGLPRRLRVASWRVRGVEPARRGRPPAPTRPEKRRSARCWRGSGPSRPRGASRSSSSWRCSPTARRNSSSNPSPASSSR